MRCTIARRASRRKNVQEVTARINLGAINKTSNFGQGQSCILKNILVRSGSGKYTRMRTRPSSVGAAQDTTKY